MNRSGRRVGHDTRGVSELLGTVLLISVVIGGAMIVVGYGLVAMDSVKTQQQEETTRVVLQEVDSRLASLMASDKRSSETIDVDETVSGSIHLNEDRGWLNVSTNGGTCQANLSLDTIRRTGDDGRTVAYQAGGVWERYPGGSTAMVAPPDLVFQNGTLSLTVANISGTIDDTSNDVVRNVSASRARTANASETLVSGPCRRPSNITITVTSVYADAWADYLRDELGPQAAITASNDTVSATITQSMLPARVDDQRNDVIDFSDSAATVDLDDATITINKTGTNDYSTQVRPLVWWEPVIGTEETVTSGNVSRTTRTPNDVVLVLDKSGSMGYQINYGEDKIDAAKDAARQFVAQLNFSSARQDRVAIVSYNDVAEYEPVDDTYFSSDSSELNATIGYLVASGGTDIASALESANILLDLHSNQNTRAKYIVLLTDGQNTNSERYDDSDLDDLTKDFAEDAAAAGTTVYTIGFGEDPDDPDRDLLEAVSQETGGTYSYASSSSELEEQFANISETIATQQQIIGLSPVSTNVTVGGQVITPQVTGGTDDVASRNGSINMNDPQAAYFSHTFSLDDTETMRISGQEYVCNGWAGTGRYPEDNATVQFARCTNMTGGSALEPDAVELVWNHSQLQSVVSSDTAPWWGTDLETLAKNSTLYNATSGRYEFESNQAVVVLTYEIDGQTYTMLMLVEVGKSEQEVTGQSLINLEVNELEIG